jgi:hypothetical protein
MSPLQRYGRFVLPALIAVTLAVWVFAPSSSAKRIHGPCLVHADCHTSERCLVAPAADGFATTGQCVDPCEDDLQCPAQQRCVPLFEAGRYVTAPGSKGRTPAVGACQPGTRDEAG